MSENPYATPQSPLDAKPPEDTKEESIRREHVNHEASIQSIGDIYCIAGAITIIVGVGMLVNQLTRFDPYYLFWGILDLFLGAFQIKVGIGVRRFQTWSRIPACMYGVFYFVLLLTVNLPLALVIGLSLSTYVIAMIYGERGQTVFSDYYKQIIIDTPHIKCRTSILAWIMLVLIVGFFVFLAVMATIPRMR